jgi:hypothetical protein
LTFNTSFDLRKKLKQRNLIPQSQCPTQAEPKKDIPTSAGPKKDIPTSAGPKKDMSTSAGPKNESQTRKSRPEKRQIVGPGGDHRVPTKRSLGNNKKICLMSSILNPIVFRNTVEYLFIKWLVSIAG